MVFDNWLHYLEPVKRNLGQNLSFSRYTTWKHDIERGYSVRGNQQEIVPKIIDIPDLAFMYQGQAFDMAGVQAVHEYYWALKTA